MKKVLSVILTYVCLLAAIPVMAQNIGEDAKNLNQPEKYKPGKNINISLITGPQFTGISSIGNIISTEKVGFSAGILGETYLFKGIKIGSGIIFDRRGFGVKSYIPFIAFPDTVSDKSHAEMDISYRVDYLTFPLNVIYESSENRFRFYIQGTLYYSLFLSTYREGFYNIYIHPDDIQFVNTETYPNISSGDNITLYNEKTDLFLGNEKFRNFDFGIVFYLGAQYELTKNLSIYFAPGFTSSFSRLLDNPKYSTTKWIKNIKLETGIKYKLK